jgi:hypothetical protein
MNSRRSRFALRIRVASLRALFVVSAIYHSRDIDLPLAGIGEALPLL